MIASTLPKFTVVVGLATFAGGCSQLRNLGQGAEWEAKVTSFFVAKEAQARRLAELEQLASGKENPREMAPEVWPYFDAGKAGDSETATRLYDQMSPRSYQFAAEKETLDDRLSSMVWQTVNETYRFLAQCSVANPRYLLSYGSEVIESIPPGSIYLCGSDSGRFVVTGLCRNQPAGDPFFVVSLNQLSDGLFLQYAETMYGKKINVLTSNDSLAAFKDYLEDVQRRASQKKLNPEEHLSFTNGIPQVTGARAVFEIIARLTRTFFEKNPQREFFVDFVNDGYPIEWMYPHLVPHGPTLRVNRQPLVELAQEDIARDRSYWAERVATFLGSWIKNEPSVSEICVFAEQVYVRKNLANFKGDPAFVTTGRNWHQKAAHLGASVAWGHARTAIASVYLWRVRNAKSSEERQRMIVETDNAFRQAFALCPYSRETVYSYVNYLLATGRQDDALRVAGIATILNPEECSGVEEQLKELVKQHRL